MENILIMSEQSITTERIKDLLCCAFEGGIGYWAIVDDGTNPADMKKVGAEYYHEIPALGGEFAIYDKEDYNGQEPLVKLGVINHDRIAMALQWMARGTDEKGKDCPHYKKHFANFIGENEDADTGDIFVQLAVMGSVAFG